MTRFEKDYQILKLGADRYILENRYKEIEKLKREKRACKNGFRYQCICQDLERLEREYEILEELF